MKHTLALVLMVFGLGGCSQQESNDFENIEITCSSPFTEERIKDINNVWMKAPLKSSGIESSIEATYKNMFRENVEKCIADNYPAQEYILTFKKAYLDIVGQHSITMRVENCGWVGPEEMYKEKFEFLRQMNVTENYLITEEARSLRINKSSLTGTKLSTYNEAITGPYPYTCVAREF